VGNESKPGLDDLLREIGIDLIARPAPQAPKQLSIELKCLRAIDVLPGAPLATAHHEAGHVLVGIFLGRKLRTGVLLSKATEVSFYERKNEADEDVEARIKIAIAGPIAEAAFAGHSAGFTNDIEKAWECARAIDNDDEEAALSRLKRLAEEVRAILAVAPVDEVARGIVQGKARSKKKLEAGLRQLEWGTGAEIAMDEAARSAHYLGLAAPPLQLAPALRDLVQRFLAALSTESRAWLFRRTGAIRLVGRDDVAYVSRIGSAPSPCFVVVLRADTVQLPDPQAFAIIAHELGHVRFHYLEGRATDQGTPGEIQADAFALECGFANGLREHLEGQRCGANAALQEQLRHRVAAIDAFLQRRREHMGAIV
jgi:hypothetical protein